MNRNKGILVLFFLLLFGGNMGCQNNSKDKILGLSEMQEVLTEMHLLEAYSEKQAGSIFIRRDLREEMYNEVLAKRDLPLETFTQSYEYYLEHPVELDTIYARMIKRLEARLDSINEADFRYENVRKKDNSSPKSQTGPLNKTIKNSQNR